MNLNRLYKNAILLLAAFGLLLPTTLLAETATFDSLEEGKLGPQLEDGGITFFNLDNGFSYLENAFAIEKDDGTLDASTFSAPNGLTATSCAPPEDPDGAPDDSGLGFGTVKSVSMRTGGDADAASMDVHVVAAFLTDNTVTLEAVKDGEVVDEDAVALKDVEDDHFVLAIENSDFDTLRLVSSPNAQALMLDNVTINTVGPVNECECDFDQSGACDLKDWRVFGEDWGRDDCPAPGSGDLCSCDMNEDGRCDLKDWRIFGEDWGRNDCLN